MKFRRGQRVLVYGAAGQHPLLKGWDLFLRGELAKVDYICNESEIVVKIVNKAYGLITVHPFQLRKVKK